MIDVIAGNPRKIIGLAASNKRLIILKNVVMQIIFEKKLAALRRSQSITYIQERIRQIISYGIPTTEVDEDGEVVT